MRAQALIAVSFALFAAPAWAAPVGTIAAGEDLCQLNRGQDQLKAVSGTAVEEGDLVKCIGRTRAKAFIGNVLIQFGPLSEAKLISASPLVLELAKGSIRIMTAPGEAASFTVKTGRAVVRAAKADVFVRYNASSEFTEVVAIEGTAQAENTGFGAAGSVSLNPMESSLLSPESAPTQPSPLSEAELRSFTRDTDLAAAPLPGGDLYQAVEPTMQRIGDAYGDARRRFARPALPLNAPFRTLDSRREAFVTPQFDQPGRDVAPGGASLDLRYSFDEPKLKAE